MSKQKRNLIVLATLVLLIAVTELLFQRYRASKEPAVYAVIQYRGEVYEKLDLSKDTELRIEDDIVGYNVIRVQDGGVCVTEADCPDQICVQSGALSETGGVIACLPHDLLIYIESEEE
ncbi:MAG: NusG domain II-containing protein [Lachnospiraceae bacterium]|nr:NusG domain II-containing protein [Lachnospiraceae bacterium]